MNKQNKISACVMLTILSGVALTFPGAVPAENLAYGYNVYGGPGLIDMPAANSFEDAELAYNYTQFQNTLRNVLSFQLTPRLSTSFRYSQLYDINVSGDPAAPDIYEYVFDRSFALHYRFVDEGTWRPAIAVGLNDFLGTGFFESEYFVASKTFGPDIRATVGIGWGRLAGVNSFENPFSIFGDSWSDRGSRTTSNTGGEVESVEWFQGDAALFGGIEWQATERLRLIAEYSSDTYPYEDGYAFDQKSPFNFGVSYQLTPGWTVATHYLYGSELAFQATYALNPRFAPFGSGRESAPLPVVRRDDAAAASWGPNGTGDDSAIVTQTAQLLDQQGIGLVGFALDGRTARVEIENTTYRINTQAIGRTARVLSRTMPGGVDSFAIVLIDNGMAISEVRIDRSDVETLEHELDGAWLSYTRADISDPERRRTDPLPGVYPRADWAIEPYLAYSFFDPDAPLRVQGGLDFSAWWQPAPGFVLEGMVRQPLFGNLDDATRTSDSTLPHVRSDANIYDKASPAISRLTGAYYFRPADDLFGRVTVGYLEPMFGGVSAELLWAPNGSRFALGTEINEVVQRDYDQLFGFQDYQVTTGHVSGYWDIKSGYTARIDMGRYLAGDWGATVALDREFDNGWVVGAFATLTDVPFDEFGEGSFDKGIIVSIPIDWALGTPRQDNAAVTLRPILRDGGARLSVDGRLYEVIHDEQGPALADTWGRFWR